MATSQEYMQQLESYNQTPDFRTVIAEAYDKPVVRPVIDNIANIESQYLPTLFDTFTNTGTGAGDMSTAAKLQMIGSNLGRLTSKANAGGNVLNFYDQTVDSLANRASQNWVDKKNTLAQLYQMAFQKEEADRAERARLANQSSLDALRALMNRNGIGGDATQPTVNPLMKGAVQGMQGAIGGAYDIPSSPPRVSLEQLQTNPFLRSSFMNAPGFSSRFRTAEAGQGAGGILGGLF